MGVHNFFELSFPAQSRNEAFARVVVAAFAAQLDPTLEELTDVKTAVSEAVTNAVIHGYGDKGGDVIVAASLDADGTLTVSIKDTGVGIPDLDQAREALYTSRPDLERSGMGFTIIENFMDNVTIRTAPGEGTVVTMVKKLSGREQGGYEQA